MLETSAISSSAVIENEKLDLALPNSPALRRLIEEVRNEGTQLATATAYNRTYHRHNR